MLDRTGLARKPATLDGGFDVILTPAVGDVERLVDHQAKRGAREVDFLLAAVDDDLARARLQPDPRNGVLAAAGRIGAAMLVELLLAKRCGFRGRRSCRSFVSGGRGLSLGSRSLGCRLLLGQRGEIGKGLLVGHYAPTLFLRFI